MSKSGSGTGKVIAGVVIGMALGVAAAGFVAWYISEKGQNPFIEAPTHNKPISVPLVQAPAAPAPIEEADEQEQFEFYRVLTDKEDSNKQAAPKPQPAAPTSTATVAQDKLYIQAGSFQNTGDAEKLKARLALSGFEANVQEVEILGKGTWYRVRLGPYTETEADKKMAALKQNGIAATQVRAP